MGDKDMKMMFSLSAAWHKALSFAPAAVAGMAVYMLAGCGKTVEVAAPGRDSDSNEIVFRSRDVSMATRTAPSVVTDLTSFNVAAVRDVNAVETAVWNTTATLEGTLYTTDRFWPVDDLGFRFYASNAALTLGAAGATVSVDCTQDVACAYLPNPTFQGTNTLAFNHILSRVGSIAFDSEEGYTVAVSAVSVSGAMTGTYNLKTGAWSGLGSAVVQTGAEGSVDLWFVPGTCTLTATFTLTKGDFTKEYTETASLTLEGGKVSSVTAHIYDDDAVGIAFSATVTPWQPQATEITLD